MAPPLSPFYSDLISVHGDGLNPGNISQPLSEECLLGNSKSISLTIKIILMLTFQNSAAVMEAGGGGGGGDGELGSWRQGSGELGSSMGFVY